MKNIDQKILQFLNLSPRDYFGIEDWKENFPAFTFTFGKITLPNEESLKQTSPVPIKRGGSVGSQSIEDSLKKGDYFVFVVPTKINGAPVCFKNLYKVFFRKLLMSSFSFEDNCKSELEEEKAKSGLHICLKESHEMAKVRKGLRGPESFVLPQSHFIHNVSEEFMKQILFMIKNKKYIQTSGRVNLANKAIDKVRINVNGFNPKSMTLTNERRFTNNFVFLTWNYQGKRIIQKGKNPNKAFVYTHDKMYRNNEDSNEDNF